MIVHKFLAEASNRLREKKLQLKADNKAVEWLVAHGFDEKLGARPMERLIRDEILSKLVDRLLFGDGKQGGTVRVSADSTGIIIR